MPYLPLDLDAKRKLEAIEWGLGLPRRTMVGGTMDLWESVWRAWMGGAPIGVADVVDDLAMCSAFGPDQRIRDAMVVRGFLEIVTETTWRVRGAAKWLFGLEGKSRGGKAAKGNLNQGTKPGALPGSPTAIGTGLPGVPGPMPGPMPEDTSRLDPRLLHPAPSTQQLTTSFAGAVAPPSADPVGAFGGMPVQQVLDGALPGRRLDDAPKKRPKPEKPPDPRHHPLKLRLMTIFLELRKATYDFTGLDGRKLSELLAKGTDDEIEARWRRGLLAPGSFREHCDSLLDLVGNWNRLAGKSADPPKHAGGARFHAAQDSDPNAFAKTGTVDDF